MVDFFDDQSVGDPQTTEDHFQSLCVRYFENELDDDQWNAFNELLRTNESLRERFFEQCSCTYLISELLRSEHFAEHTVTQRLSEEHVESVNQRSSKRRWLTRQVSIVLAGVVTILLALVVYFQNDPVPPATDATISYLVSDVVIHDAKGKPRRAEVGQRVDLGESVETRGSRSLAAISYDDGTRVVIAPNTLIQCAHVGGKTLTIDQGAITVSVSPQPADVSMVINTPQARVDVPGTVFSLEASGNHTNLRVTDGRVKFTRKTDGKFVVAKQGTQVATNPFTADLVVRRSTPISEWSEDFEAGLPDGWQIGEFVEDGMPGSNGAVRAADDNNSGRYTIATAQRWIDGLFVVHENSHLRMTVRMTHPNWVNMFFLIHTNDLDDPSYLAICDIAPFSTMQPNDWYTVVIPINSLKAKSATGSGFDERNSPKPGQRIYDIAWTSTGPDRGLVIDRVWVTRGGPGKIERTLENDEERNDN